MFHDEPTIESLSMMGLAIASVGNHEFDEGKDELLRMQNGGCHPDRQMPGAASVSRREISLSRRQHRRQGTGKTVFPPYEIREFDGIPVAFIGLTLKGTPNIVSPVGVAGLEFRDEADTVNALVPELKARGVEAIVVLIHEGGYPTGDYNECPGISGADRRHRQEIRSRGRRRDQRPHPSGLCLRDRRPAGDQRRQIRHLVTAIDLKLDPATRDVVSARADNVIVRTGAYAKDPGQTALLQSYDKLAAPIANRPAGSVTADVVARGPTSPARARSAISSPTRSWPRPAPRPKAAP